MIKKIHYCWFGGNPLPKSAIRCIESWKKYFPDFEVVQWNENNFNINDTCDYVREAYKESKWAFVSDYARFKILYEFGGIYFDTDVEVIKDMKDIIMQGNFMGEEKPSFQDNKKRTYSINPGLGMYAEPNLLVYKEILDYYNTLHFLDEEGKYNGKTVVDYVTDVFKNHEFIGNGCVENILDINIYPPEYFCPMDPLSGKTVITKNTYSIHHYTASWQSKYSKLKSKLQKMLGPKVTRDIILLKRFLIRR